MRNAGWLVLIDGLDEVPDICDRDELLKAIAAHSADHPQLYRFIITTRPAPDSELGALDSETPSFSLLPFRAEDLATVARNWLTALAVPGPDDAAGNFLTSVHRAGLDSIAGIPLIIAMLCQLYARDPGRPLPGSRGGLYGQFVERLQEHFNDRGPDGLRAHTAAEMARCGPAAADEAALLRANLLDLISYLAAERWRGSTVPALDVIVAHPSARRPAAVRAPEWRSFLDSCLRHSGLLTPMDDDLVFLHQTFLEYLAARHADRLPETLTSALRDATGRTARYRPGAADMTAPRRRGRRYWVPPPQAAASYVGFLLDAAQTRSLPIRQCGIVFDKPGLNRTREGADFLIALMETGTRLPDHLRQPTTDLLYALALAYTPALLHSSRLRDEPMHLITVHDDHQARLRAIRVLTELGDPRGTEILHGLALSPGVLEIFREEHARELAMLGDQRGAELLAGFAGDPGFFDGSRVSAARDLAELGDQRGADLLAALSDDRGLDGHRRVEAAHELAKLGDPRGGRRLESLALAHVSQIVPVVEAARKLVELGHPSAADTLEYIATDERQAGIFRTEAARELAKLDDPRVADTWLAIARTPGLHDDQSRVEAARELTKLGDPLAVDAWRGLAHDPERDSGRVAAARELAKLGDPRIADTWRALAHDPGLRPGSRRIAAEELVRLRDPRAADTCHILAHNPDLASDWRMASARGLAELGDLRAASTWRALAHDPVLEPGSRAAAAGELAKLPRIGHVTGSALTVTSQVNALMVTGSDDGMMRLWRVGTGRLELVGEPQEGHPYGCSVAVAVGQLGDRLVAVTGGSDGSVRLWQITGDRLVQTGDPQRTAGTESVAVGKFGDHLVAVTGGSSADVKLWRVQEDGLVPVGDVRFHGGYWVGAVTVGHIGGHPVAITGAADGSVQLWRISEDGLTPAGNPHPGSGSPVQAAALGHLDGHPVAVTGASDGSVQLWRISEDGLSGTHRRPGSLPRNFLLEYLEHDQQVITPAGEPHPGSGSPVQAAALGHLDGHPVAVTGGYDGMVQLWRADDQELVPAGEPQRGHGEQRVISVDIAQIGARTMALTAGRDWTVRLWQVGQGGLAPRSEDGQ